MNQLLFSCLTALVFFLHLGLRPAMRKGHWKEVICCLWCIDALFAVCGTFLCFSLYRYTMLPYVTFGNFLWLLLFAGVTFLFLLLAPSGFSILKKSGSSQEELLLAEYRFQDTACMVRNILFLLQFLLPVFLTALSQGGLSGLLPLPPSQLCGGFYFAAFVVLLPLCLRQSLFWLRHLSEPLSEQEASLLKNRSARLRYRGRNIRL